MNSLRPRKSFQPPFLETKTLSTSTTPIGVNTLPVLLTLLTTQCSAQLTDIHWKLAMALSEAHGYHNMRLSIQLGREYSGICTTIFGMRHWQSINFNKLHHGYLKKQSTKRIAFTVIRKLRKSFQRIRWHETPILYHCITFSSSKTTMEVFTSKVSYRNKKSSSPNHVQTLPLHSSLPFVFLSPSRPHSLLQSLFSISSQPNFKQGPLTGDKHLIPPSGWTNLVEEIWKRVFPAYVLVVSGSLWQLSVENWLFEKELEHLPGVPYLVVLWKEESVILLLAYIVDEMIFARKQEAITEFEKAMCAKFDVCILSSGSDIVFNHLFIQQHSDVSITAIVDEFLTPSESISLPHTRGKMY